MPRYTHEIEKFVKQSASNHRNNHGALCCFATHLQGCCCLALPTLKGERPVAPIVLESNELKNWNSACSSYSLGVDIIYKYLGTLELCEVFGKFMHIVEGRGRGSPTNAKPERIALWK